MSTKAIPQIPPRPTRAHEQVSSNPGATLGSDMPKIPPRPINRRIERSVSPHRESFARSPLNDPSFTPKHDVSGGNGGLGKSSLYSSGSARTSTTDLPPRPSSVVLPSIGQEGNEYAEIFGLPSDELEASPTQTKSIADDLHLHAPKPSLPASSAKQRVSTVTRTDSSQAAALGIGKPSSSVDDREPHTRSLKTKSSILSQNSSGTERPPSSVDNEQGIPEIGQRVPMYPNAGDVQAPSPSPLAATFQPGIGFHNDGTKPRHHGRRVSGRGFDGPPGSYGLHGHGLVTENKFEKAYYEKHPELLKKEVGGQYGGLENGRGEWAMSSEDLNKIVRDTASRSSGLGSAPPISGPPDEQIGFLASEEYTSRMSSPRPQSNSQHKPSNASQTHADSPLRKESSTNPLDAEGLGESTGRSRQGSENALTSEYEDDDVVHIDTPEQGIHKFHKTSSDMDSTEHLAPSSSHGEEDHSEDRGYSAPILASDEVAKEPFGYDLQPAVSPLNQRREEPFHYRTNSGTSSAYASQPSSRPSSIHGVPGIRYQAEHERESHSTPLEDLEEYEPLFPEDEKKASAFKEKPLTAAEKLKRPELKNRKFPSQDIWEDSPNSLHYTATVSTPQLPEESDEQNVQKKLHVQEGASPEQAFARRQEELAEEEALDSDSFLNREKKPWAHKSYLSSETRPGMKQRFPSKDIWEDSPDSLMLETTVQAPQSEEIITPLEERPTTGAVIYHQEKAAAGLPLGPEEGRATTGLAAIMKPQIPARPSKQKPSNLSASSSPTDTKGPPLPLKSKPIIPARPVKLVSRESSEDVPLAKTTSASSTKSVGSDQGAAAAKPKPPVPSRPIGSKIAALQGGFMSDLNKRLQLGPQAPKKEEPAPEEAVEEKEKVPLVDARKGRARGPARRAPAKSPAPATAVATEESKPVFTLTITEPSTVWSLDPETSILDVVAREQSIPSEKALESSNPVPASSTEVQSSKESEEAEAEVPATSEGQVEDMTGSTGTIKQAKYESTDEISQTGEQIIHTNTGVGNEHPTAGTKERLVAYIGGAAPDEGDVIMKEPVGPPSETVLGKEELEKADEEESKEKALVE